MWTVVLFVLVCLGALPAHGAMPMDEAFRIDRWGEAAGLGQGTVTSIAQDPQGYLWVGTFGGLMRFSGEQFVNGPSVAGDNRLLVRLTALFQDGPVLWVGMQTDGVWQMVDGQYLAVSQPQTLSGATIWSIQASQRGGIVVTSSAGTFHRDPSGVWTVLGFVNGQRTEELLGPDMMMSSESGLWRLKPGGAAELVVDTITRATATDPWGGLWVLGEKGLALYDGDEEYLPEAALRHPAGVGGQFIEDAQGRVWVGIGDQLFMLGSWGEARSRMRSGEPVAVAEMDLPGEVRSAFVDRDDQLWIGLVGEGLMRISARPYSRLPVVDEEDGTVLRWGAGPLSGFGSRLWVAMECDKLLELRGREVLAQHTVGEAAHIRSTCISALAASADGGAFVGTQGRVLRLDDGVWSNVRVDPPLWPSELVTLLQVDWAGQLLMGTDEGRLFQGSPDQGALRLVPTPSELGQIKAALREPVGLSLGTTRGLWLQRAGEWILLSGAAGFAPGEVRHLHRDERGVLWGATYGGGLGYVVDEHIGRLNTQDNGLTDGFLSAIIDDGQGGLWLQGNRGMAHLSRPEIESVLYQQAEKLSVQQVPVGEANGYAQPSAWADPSGQVWLATTDGAVQFDMSAAMEPIQPGAVHVEEVEVGGHVYSAPSGPIDVPPEQGRALTVKFSSPVLNPLRTTRYAWRLLPEGAKGALVAFGRPSLEDSVRFADLAPGRYRFQVYAVASDDLQGALQELVFTIPPTLWERTSVRVGSLLLALLLVVGVVRFRLKEVEKRNTLLREEVLQRKAAELRLQDQKLYYRGIFETAGNAFLLYDDAGTCLDVNPEACRLFGGSRTELTSTPAESLGLAAIDTESVGQPRSCRRCDGGTFVGRVARVALRVGDENRVLVSVVDLTELMEVRDEQERLQAQLQTSRRIEALGRLAGGVAHDMNNVITAVLGNIVLIEEANVEGDEEIAESVHEIRASAERGTRLVRRLLAFGRQRGSGRERLDPDAVAQDMKKMLVRLLPEDIRLVVVPGSPGPVQIDRTELEQVLLNLVTNAGDAMPQGGQVTVRTFRDGPWVCLEVQDQGMGMAPDVRAQVYEPFFTTKSVVRGTGLGLATVRDIVNGAGGTIQLRSVPGQGTAFSVRFPLASVDVPVPAEPEPVHQLPLLRGDGEGILLVDDDDQVRRAMVIPLRRAGYRVVDFGNPVAAVAWMEHHCGEIDLVLTDVVMPEMNGRELSDQLRLLRPDVPVLFVSAYTDRVMLDRGIDGTAENILSKPFSPAELATRVRRLLGPSRVCEPQGASPMA